MARAPASPFETLRTEGGLLPSDLLARVAAGDPDLPGLSPSDYGLVAGERINEMTSRAWTRVLAAWARFREVREGLAPGAATAGLTRERWLFILFEELGYGRLTPARGLRIEDRDYPVSHLWRQSPVHLVGFDVDLDRRTPGVAGAARRSPHSLVQEFLNRSDDHLWGIVSNGLRLRLLRDNVSLTRHAFVEFDLEAMLEGESYADFALLWLVLHASRLEPRPLEEGGPPLPEGCWLERWTKVAAEQGARALEGLRGGVEAALEALGRGFLAYPGNRALKAALRSGELTTQGYYQELLRLVYRLLFLFVAEDRDLLHPPGEGNDAKARERYREYYSTRRLRTLAERRRGGPHPDLYRALRLVMSRLGSDEGCPELALPALGSFLWSDEALAHLGEADLANRDLLAAVRALAFTEREGRLRAVDYRNLGTEELGSVYESLLELHPELEIDAPRFSLGSAAGHERKTTGSYYTPASLVDTLLDTALEPVLDAAAADPDPEAALLRLKICDPACGSGHFLIAAAHRVARRLAAVRTGEDEPAPDARRTALRDVIGHCIYAVDLNPLAVELCKVSLWIEAIDPGRPLSFLDHHIQCGNSLLGATPALLASGIPDDAFKPIEGDDGTVAAALRRQNRAERRGQRTMYADLVAEARPVYIDLAAQIAALEALPDDSPAALREKEETWRRLQEQEVVRRERRRADAWCAAFFWPKRRDAPEAPTQEVFWRLGRDPGRVPAATLETIDELAREHRFFHFHLAFPEVFRPGEEREGREAGSTRGSGFDVVLSNPPWERIKLQEKEFFAARDPETARAPNAAARRRLIDRLESENPKLFAEFQAARRAAEGASHFVRDSGRYPLCGRGDVNTYAVFAELMRDLTAPSGRLGAVVPSGIATDDTTKHFFRDLTESGALASLYDFENAKPLFPGVHRSYKFCLLTVKGTGRPGEAAELAFFLHDPADLADPERRFRLSGDDIALLNPNTRTCPVFRTRRDAELTKWIYRRVPVLVREGPPEENPWGVSFMTMFHMSNDSGLFRTREELEAGGFVLHGNVFEGEDERCLPLYEAKMVHHFDHRWATYETERTRDLTPAEKDDPACVPLPRYWVAESEVEARLAGRWSRRWLLGWRDICRSTDERTVISSVVPRVGVGHKMPLFSFTGTRPREITGFWSAGCSFVLDFVARQKVGGTSLTYHYLRQFPFPSPTAFSGSSGVGGDVAVVDWLLPRVLELTYTAHDLAPFARDLGYEGPPFRWDEERRFWIRCELDAAFFHLYLGSPGEWRAKGPPELLEAFPTPRDAVEHVMESFPIVKRKDERAHGEYRTKAAILDLYDRMQRAIETGEPYETVLDPPPGDPRAAHRPPGARPPAGEAYRLPELRDLDLAGETVPVQVGDGEDGVRRFRFLDAGDPAPRPSDLVIVCHPRLAGGHADRGIAAGKMLWARQQDMETGEPLVLVTIRSPSGKATLTLSEEEWEAFRPLAVAVPERDAEGRPSPGTKGADARGATHPEDPD